MSKLLIWRTRNLTSLQNSLLDQCSGIVSCTGFCFPFAFFSCSSAGITLPPTAPCWSPDSSSFKAWVHHHPLQWRMFQSLQLEIIRADSMFQWNFLNNSVIILLKFISSYIYLDLPVYSICQCIRYIYINLLGTADAKTNMAWALKKLKV